MRRLCGIVLAGGIVLGLASSAKAQFSLSVGNPYGGGLAIGSGYYGGYGYPNFGYGYGSGNPGFGTMGFAPGLGVTTYSSGYSGYVAPGTTSFSTGYYGGYPAYGYGFNRAYPYAGYGYRRYAAPGFGFPVRGFGRVRGW